jgi:hypothetical protein
MWRKRTSQALLVNLLDRFGRDAFDPLGVLGLPPQPSFDFMEVLPLIEQAGTDPARFTAAMQSVAAEPPTWAMYGACRLMFEAFSMEAAAGPDRAVVVDGGIRFLRAYGVPPMHVPGFIWNRFIATGGTIQTWLPARPVPGHGDVTLTPLAPGETRLVAILTAAPDSNRILASKLGDQFAQVVEARTSDDDPTRTTWVNQQGPTLHDLFIAIGSALQSPTHWHHPELEAFIPLPRPALPA